MTTDTTAQPMTLDDMLALLGTMEAALEDENAAGIPRENLVVMLRPACKAIRLLLEAGAVLNEHIVRQDLALALAKLEVPPPPAGNRKARRAAAARARH